MPRHVRLIAGLVALLAGPLLLTGCGATSTSAVLPHRILALDPMGPTFIRSPPATRPPPPSRRSRPNREESARGPAVGPCRAESLRAGVIDRDSVMNQPFVDVRIRTEATRPCALRGYPQLRTTPADAATPQLSNGLRITHGVYVNRARRVARVLVSRGHPAYTTLETDAAVQGGRHVFVVSGLALVLGDGGAGAVPVKVGLAASRRPGHPVVIGVSSFRSRPVGVEQLVRQRRSKVRCAGHTDEVRAEDYRRRHLCRSRH